MDAQNYTNNQESREPVLRFWREMKAREAAEKQEEETNLSLSKEEKEDTN